jgi:hypothetical protein
MRGMFRMAIHLAYPPFIRSSRPCIPPCEVFHAVVPHVIDNLRHANKETIMLVKLFAALDFFIRMRDAAEAARRLRPEEIRHFVLPT